VRGGDFDRFKVYGSFDYIILSDLVNDLWDVQSALENVKILCRHDTRIILNFHSNVWNVPLSIARKLGIASPVLRQNWLTPQDLINLFQISGFEVLKSSQEVICPIYIPFLSNFLNKYIARLGLFRFFCTTNFLVARPLVKPNQVSRSLSIIVPARNEAGNIEEILMRIPEMPRGSEIIFVEGYSKDNTYEVIEATIKKYPNKNAKLIKQTGAGKGNAVREGFDIASGDIFIILDADITVPPEDLYRFYQLIIDNSAEFVNGVRLVYPMDDKAMQFANLIGNKFFSCAFSWLLGQPIRDTLCGSKALTKESYRKIAENRNYFGNFDPFGDFDLLFGAAKLNLKILEVPIRYRSRNYGETNISRWYHGWLLLKMVLFAIKKIKFI
jgi:hypothetical protein